MTEFKIKRVYEEPTKADGYRVLVDRLWPRGVSKEKAALDEWNKEVAPSPELREWFGHRPERFEEFVARYQTELEENEAVESFREAVKDNKVVTLLYAARDQEANQAIVLQEFLKR